MADPAQPRPALTRGQWRQIALLTAGALALFVVVRRLPTGTNLGHMDFRVAGGAGIEFCDPANPQFLPVVAVPSPVTMSLSAATLELGREQPLVLTLRTATGKPIGPADLAVAHTRKLHLLVVDPSLQDYQHLHPEPGGIPGEWRCVVVPRRGGLYRVFADFVPIATGRGLYAAAEFTVAHPPAVPSAQPGSVCDREGLRFTLTTATAPRARETIDLALAVERLDGAPARLDPVMGAFAHLVAFDEQRLGFAHLHPNETDLARPPDPVHPRLTFKVTLPQAGLYFVWAQVQVAGRDIFAPFVLRVEG